ncbi:MAG: 6-phosphofructokinase, partial [Elusimicrobia bacterium]|nr:6-phosphofructokinase [Candidatus Liberimonas magnetica]
MMKKLVSIIILTSFLVSFVFNDALHAVLDVKVISKQPLPVLEDFIIPQTSGRVTDSKFFDSKQIIVNIQDLHCHSEVQRNISKILSALDTKYGLENVYVEGGYGDINTSWICNVKDKDLKKEIIEKLVNQGRLTGSEYYSVLSDRPNLLKGIEDEAVHKSNIIRLGKILNKKAYYEDKIKEFDLDLMFMKAKYFSSNNNSFNKLIEKHKARAIATDEYYKKLSGYIKKITENPNSYNNIFSLSLNNYPNINAYLELSRCAKELKYKRISSQMQNFIQLIKSKLPYSTYAAIIQKTDNFSKTDELYLYLGKIAKSSGFSGRSSKNQFSDLYKFLDYAEKRQTLNPIKLIEEEKRLVEEIRIGFSKDTSEIDISFLCDFYIYFKDYLSNTLSAEDYEYFKQRFGKFKQVWGRYALSGRLTELSDDFKLLDEFYKTNCERNDCFLKNIKELEPQNQNFEEVNITTSTKPSAGTKISETLKNSKIIVIVTGGFHTEGLKKIFQEKKMSYIAITPNVTQDTRISSLEYAELAKKQAQNLSVQSTGFGSLTNSSKPGPGNSTLALVLGSMGAKIIEVSKDKENKIEKVVVEINEERIELKPGENKEFNISDALSEIEKRVTIIEDAEYAAAEFRKIIEAFDSFTNPLAATELIFGLIKVFAEYGSKKDLFGSDGIIFAIASNKKVLEALEKNQHITAEVLGGFPEILQQLAANKAIDEENLLKKAKTPLLVAIVKAINSSEISQKLLNLVKPDTNAIEGTAEKIRKIDAKIAAMVPKVNTELGLIESGQKSFYAQGMTAKTHVRITVNEVSGENGNYAFLSARTNPSNLDRLSEGERHSIEAIKNGVIILVPEKPAPLKEVLIEGLRRFRDNGYVNIQVAGGYRFSDFEEPGTLFGHLAEIDDEIKGMLDNPDMSRLIKLAFAKAVKLAEYDGDLAAVLATLPKSKIEALADARSNKNDIQFSDETELTQLYSDEELAQGGVFWERDRTIPLKKGSFSNGFAWLIAFLMPGLAKKYLANQASRIELETANEELPADIVIKQLRLPFISDNAVRARLAGIKIEKGGRVLSYKELPEEPGKFLRSDLFDARPKTEVSEEELNGALAQGETLLRNGEHDAAIEKFEFVLAGTARLLEKKDMPEETVKRLEELQDKILGQTIAMGLSGGDCAGLNAALASVTKTCAVKGVLVAFVENGFSGLASDKRAFIRKIHFVRLSDTDKLPYWASFVGGSSRTNVVDKKKPENTDKIVANSSRFYGHIMIGGDDHSKQAGILGGLLKDKGIPVIAIPKSVDMDFGTQMLGPNTMIEDARKRFYEQAASAAEAGIIFIEEKMGRNSGHLALHTAYVEPSGLETLSQKEKDEIRKAEKGVMILIPEKPAFFRDVLIAALTKFRDTGFLAVEMSEGFIFKDCNENNQKARATLFYSLLDLEPSLKAKFAKPVKVDNHGNPQLSGIHLYLKEAVIHAEELAGNDAELKELLNTFSPEMKDKLKMTKGVDYGFTGRGLSPNENDRLLGEKFGEEAAKLALNKETQFETSVIVTMGRKADPKIGEVIKKPVDEVAVKLFVTKEYSNEELEKAGVFIKDTLEIRRRYIEAVAGQVLDLMPAVRASQVTAVALARGVLEEAVSIMEKAGLKEPVTYKVEDIGKLDSKLADDIAYYNALCPAGKTKLESITVVESNAGYIASESGLGFTSMENLAFDNKTANIKTSNNRDNTKTLANRIRHEFNDNLAINVAGSIQNKALEYFLAKTHKARDNLSDAWLQCMTDIVQKAHSYKAIAKTPEEQKAVDQLIDFAKTDARQIKKSYKSLAQILTELIISFLKNNKIAIPADISAGLSGKIRNYFNNLTLSNESINAKNMGISVAAVIAKVAGNLTKEQEAVIAKKISELVIQNNIKENVPNLLREILPEYGVDVQYIINAANKEVERVEESYIQTLVSEETFRLIQKYSKLDGGSSVAGKIYKNAYLSVGLCGEIWVADVLRRQYLTEVSAVGVQVEDLCEIDVLTENAIVEVKNYGKNVYLRDYSELLSNIGYADGLKYKKVRKALELMTSDVSVNEQNSRSYKLLHVWGKERLLRIKENEEPLPMVLAITLEAFTWKKDGRATIQNMLDRLNAVKNNPAQFFKVCEDIYSISPEIYYWITAAIPELKQTMLQWLVETGHTGPPRILTELASLHGTEFSDDVMLFPCYEPTNPKVHPLIFNGRKIDAAVMLSAVSTEIKQLALARTVPSVRPATEEEADENGQVHANGVELKDLTLNSELTNGINWLGINKEILEMIVGNIFWSYGFYYGISEQITAVEIAREILEKAESIMKENGFKQPVVDDIQEFNSKFAEDVAYYNTLCPAGKIKLESLEVLEAKAEYIASEDGLGFSSMDKLYFDNKTLKIKTADNKDRQNTIAHRVRHEFSENLAINVAGSIQNRALEHFLTKIHRARDNLGNTWHLCQIDIAEQPDEYRALVSPDSAPEELKAVERLIAFAKKDSAQIKEAYESLPAILNRLIHSYLTDKRILSFLHDDLNLIHNTIKNYISSKAELKSKKAVTNELIDEIFRLLPEVKNDNFSACLAEIYDTLASDYRFRSLGLRKGINAGRRVKALITILKSNPNALVEKIKQLSQSNTVSSSILEGLSKLQVYALDGIFHEIFQKDNLSSQEIIEILHTKMSGHPLLESLEDFIRSNQVTFTRIVPTQGIFHAKTFSIPVKLATVIKKWDVDALEKESVALEETDMVVINLGGMLLTPKTASYVGSKEWFKRLSRIKSHEMALRERMFLTGRLLRHDFYELADEKAILLLREIKKRNPDIKIYVATSNQEELRTDIETILSNLGLKVGSQIDGIIYAGNSGGFSRGVANFIGQEEAKAHRPLKIFYVDDSGENIARLMSQQKFTNFLTRSFFWIGKTYPAVVKDYAPYLANTKELIAKKQYGSAAENVINALEIIALDAEEGKPLGSDELDSAANQIYPFFSDLLMALSQALEDGNYSQASELALSIFDIIDSSSNVFKDKFFIFGNNLVRALEYSFKDNGNINILKILFNIMDHANTLIEHKYGILDKNKQREVIMKQIQLLHLIVEKIDQLRLSSRYLGYAVIPDGKGSWDIHKIGFAGKWIVDTRQIRPDDIDTGFKLRVLASFAESLKAETPHIDENGVPERSEKYRIVRIVKDFSKIKKDKVVYWSNLVCAVKEDDELSGGLVYYVTEEFATMGPEDQKKALQGVVLPVDKAYFDKETPVVETDKASVCFLTLNPTSAYGQMLLSQGLEEAGIKTETFRAVSQNTFSAHSGGKERIKKETGYSEDEILEKMAPYNVVGVSLTDSDFSIAADWIHQIRSKYPNKIIAVGGPAANKVPDSLLVNLDKQIGPWGVNIVFRGSDIDRFVYLISRLGKSATQRNICEKAAALSFLEQGVIVKGDYDHVMLVNGIDRVQSRYVALPRIDTWAECSYTMASYGCPKKCAFCNQPQGRKFLPVNMNDFVFHHIQRRKFLMAERERLIKSGDLSRDEDLFELRHRNGRLQMDVSLYDDNFLIGRTPNFTMLFLKLLKAINKMSDDEINNLTLDDIKSIGEAALKEKMEEGKIEYPSRPSVFHVAIKQTSIDSFLKGDVQVGKVREIDWKLIQAMLEAGVTEIANFGLDGLSDTVLWQNRKGYFWAEVNKVFGKLREMNIAFGYNIIFTNPRITKFQVVESLLNFAALIQKGYHSTNQNLHTWAEYGTQITNSVIMKDAPDWQWNESSFYNMGGHIRAGPWLIPKASEYAFFEPFPIYGENENFTVKYLLGEDYLTQDTSHKILAQFPQELSELQKSLTEDDPLYYTKMEIIRNITGITGAAFKTKEAIAKLVDTRTPLQKYISDNRERTFKSVLEQLVKEKRMEHLLDVFKNRYPESEITKRFVDLYQELSDQGEIDFENIQYKKYGLEVYYILLVCYYVVMFGEFFERILKMRLRDRDMAFPENKYNIHFNDKYSADTIIKILKTGTGYLKTLTCSNPYLEDSYPGENTTLVVISNKALNPIAKDGRLNIDWQGHWFSSVHVDEMLKNTDIAQIFLSEKIYKEVCAKTNDPDVLSRITVLNPSQNVVEQLEKCGYPVAAKEEFGDMVLFHILDLIMGKPVEKEENVHNNQTILEKIVNAIGILNMGIIPKLFMGFDPQELAAILNSSNPWLASMFLDDMFNYLINLDTEIDINFALEIYNSLNDKLKDEVVKALGISVKYSKSKTEKEEIEKFLIKIPGYEEKLRVKETLRNSILAAKDNSDELFTLLDGVKGSILDESDIEFLKGIILNSHDKKIVDWLLFVILNILKGSEYDRIELLKSLLASENLLVQTSALIQCKSRNIEPVLPMLKHPNPLIRIEALRTIENMEVHLIPYKKCIPILSEIALSDIDKSVRMEAAYVVKIMEEYVERDNERKFTYSYTATMPDTYGLVAGIANIFRKDKDKLKGQWWKDGEEAGSLKHKTLKYIAERIVAPSPFAFWENIPLAINPSWFANLHEQYTLEEKETIAMAGKEGVKSALRTTFWVAFISILSTSLLQINPLWNIPVILLAYYLAVCNFHDFYNASPQGQALPMTLADSDISDIGEILKLLKGNKPYSKVRLCRRLVKNKFTPKELVDQLLILLNDPNKDVRKQAVLALGYSDDYRVVNALMKASENRYWEVNLPCITSISRLTPLAVKSQSRDANRALLDFYSGLLKNKSYEIREQAIKGLSAFIDNIDLTFLSPELASAFTKDLLNCFMEISLIALKKSWAMDLLSMIGRIGDRSIIEQLISFTLVNNLNEDVIRSAAVTACKIDRQQAVDLYLSYLRIDNKQVKKWSVLALNAIEKEFGSGASKEHILSEYLKGDYDHSLDADIVLILKNSPNKLSTSEYLIKILKNNSDPKVRESAIEALGGICNVETLRPLIETAAGDFNIQVRKKAIGAVLAVLGDKSNDNELLKKELERCSKEMIRVVFSKIAKEDDLSFILLDTDEKVKVIEVLVSLIENEDFNTSVFFALKEILKKVDKKNMAKYTQPIKDKIESSPQIKEGEFNRILVLGYPGDKDSVSYLIQLLDDPIKAQSAVKALALTGRDFGPKPRILKPVFSRLLKMINDPDDITQVNASLVVTNLAVSGIVKVEEKELLQICRHCLSLIPKMDATLNLKYLSSFIGRVVEILSEEEVEILIDTVSRRLADPSIDKDESWYLGEILRTISGTIKYPSKNEAVNSLQLFGKYYEKDVDDTKVAYVFYKALPVLKKTLGKDRIDVLPKPLEQLIKQLESLKRNISLVDDAEDLIVFLNKKFNDTVKNEFSKNNVPFNARQAVLDPVVRYGLALSAARMLRRFDVPITDDSIALASQIISRNVISNWNMEVANNKTYVLGFFNDEDKNRFNGNELDTLLMNAGVRPIDKKYSHEAEPAKVLQELGGFLKENPKENKFIWFYCHGSEDNKLYLSNVPATAISVEAFVDTLENAYKSGVDLSKVNIVLACCFSHNFAVQAYNKLKKRGIDVLPTIVTLANKDVVGYSKTKLFFFWDGTQFGYALKKHVKHKIIKGSVTIGNIILSGKYTERGDSSIFLAENVEEIKKKFDDLKLPPRTEKKETGGLQPEADVVETTTGNDDGKHIPQTELNAEVPIVEASMKLGRMAVTSAVSVLFGSIIILSIYAAALYLKMPVDINYLLLLLLPGTMGFGHVAFLEWLTNAKSVRAGPVPDSFEVSGIKFIPMPQKQVSQAFTQDRVFFQAQKQKTIQVNPGVYSFLTALNSNLVTKPFLYIYLYAAGTLGHEVYHLTHPAAGEARTYTIAQLLPAFLGTCIAASLFLLGIVSGPAAILISLFSVPVLIAITGYLIVADAKFNPVSRWYIGIGKFEIEHYKKLIAENSANTNEDRVNELLNLNISPEELDSLFLRPFSLIFKDDPDYAFVFDELDIKAVIGGEKPLAFFEGAFPEMQDWLGKKSNIELMKKAGINIAYMSHYIDESGLRYYFYYNYKAIRRIINENLDLISENIRKDLGLNTESVITDEQIDKLVSSYCSPDRFGKNWHIWLGTALGYGRKNAETFSRSPNNSKENIQVDELIKKLKISNDEGFLALGLFGTSLKDIDESLRVSIEAVLKLKKGVNTYDEVKNKLREKESVNKPGLQVNPVGGILGERPESVINNEVDQATLDVTSPGMTPHVERTLKLGIAVKERIQSERERKAKKLIENKPDIMKAIEPFGEITAHYGYLPWAELYNSAGENADGLFKYGLPVVYNLIKDKESLVRVGNNLVALGRNIRYLPEVKELIMSEEDLLSVGLNIREIFIKKIKQDKLLSLYFTDEIINTGRAIKVIEQGGLSNILLDTSEPGVFYKVDKPESMPSYNNAILREAVNLIELSDLGKKGMLPELLKIGVNRNGEVWLKLKGIENGQDINSKSWESLPFTQKIDILIKAARIFLEIHLIGRLHNDIKPGNILFNKKGEVMVIDLGSSTLIGRRPPSITRGFSPVFDLPFFMCDSDVYSFGKTIKKAISDNDIQDNNLGRIIENMSRENRQYRRPGDMKGVISILKGIKKDLDKRKTGTKAGMAAEAAILPENLDKVNRWANKEKTAFDIAIRLALIEFWFSFTNSKGFIAAHTNENGIEGAKLVVKAQKVGTYTGLSVGIIAGLIGFILSGFNANLITFVAGLSAIIIIALLGRAAGNIRTHIVVDYNYIKSSGLIKAVREFGAATIDENGEVSTKDVRLQDLTPSTDSQSAEQLLTARHAAEIDVLRKILSETGMPDETIKSSAVSLSLEILATQVEAVYYTTLPKKDKDEFKKAHPERAEFLESIRQQYEKELENMYQKEVNRLEGRETEISRSYSQSIDKILAGIDTSGLNKDIVQKAKQIAAYSLKLSVPLEYLHTTGVDSRSVIDQDTGLNEYGNSPIPNDVKQVSNSTSSNPTERQFNDIENKRQKFVAKAVALGLEGKSDKEIENAVNSEFVKLLDSIRGEILSLLGLDNNKIKVLTASSATDVEFLVLLCAFAVFGPDAKIYNEVSIPAQVGSGTLLAALAKHFDAKGITPFRKGVKQGELLEGFKEGQIEPIVIDFGEEAVDKQVKENINKNLIENKESKVIIHLVASTKSGANAVSLQTAKDLMNKYNKPGKPRVLVAVDCAQMRGEASSPEMIRKYLDNGFIVFISGSKFFGAFPFCGAVLLPEGVSEELAKIESKNIPKGLRDYFSSFDFPACFSNISQAMPIIMNAGLAMRWLSGLFHWSRYAKIPKALQTKIAQQLVNAVKTEAENIAPNTISLANLPISSIEDGQNTIVSLMVKNASGVISLKGLKTIRSLCQKDINDKIPLLDEENKTIASAKILTANPYEVRPGEAAIRIAFGAEHIAAIYENTDFQNALNALLKKHNVTNINKLPSGANIKLDAIIQNACAQTVADTRILLKKIGLISGNIELDVQTAKQTLAAAAEPKAAILPKNLGKVNRWANEGKGALGIALRIGFIEFIDSF